MIYCIEDDDDIRELMIYTMKTAGFEANGFVDGLDFWKLIRLGFFIFFLCIVQSTQRRHGTIFVCSS